jgi:uncharacterized protein (TIGR02646 family)
MRKQTRPPKPNILEQHGERWSRQWAELRRKNPNASFQWYQAEGQTVRQWCLPILKEMNQSHCAFCDAFPLEDRSKEPIEHFKPKTDSRFYADAYAWDNLYYCCERCQSSKGEQWDDGLIRPDAPDYSFETYFLFDYITGQIKANCRADPDDQVRAEVTIRIYGLDIEERRRARSLELRRWQRSVARRLDDWAYRDFLDAPDSLESPATSQAD